MDMSWFWGTGGTSLFDFYSLQHAVWFIALTLPMYAIFKKHVWMAMIAVAFIWEIFEKWIVVNVPSFPFAGSELFINKVVGDSISDFIGFLIAILLIKIIRKEKHE
jgi:hypothetical protein